MFESKHVLVQVYCRTKYLKMCSNNMFYNVLEQKCLKHFKYDYFLRTKMLLNKNVLDEIF